MLENENMPARWVAMALAGLAVGGLMFLLYYSASWLSPRLFPRTYAVDTGRGTVELRRGMPAEEVVAALGKPTRQEAMALKRFRQWVYEFEEGRPYGLVFENGRLDAVTAPGQRRPAPWRARGRRR